MSGMSDLSSDQINGFRKESLLENVRTKLIDAANEKVRMYFTVIVYVRMSCTVPYCNWLCMYVMYVIMFVCVCMYAMSVFTY